MSINNLQQKLNSLVSKDMELGENRLVVILDKDTGVYTVSEKDLNPIESEYHDIAKIMPKYELSNEVSWFLYINSSYYGYKREIVEKIKPLLRKFATELY